MIEDLFQGKLQKKMNDHHGQNHIYACRLYSHHSLKKIDFIDIAIIPPGSTIGKHTHENDEESYIILEGRGRMTIDNQTLEVQKGMILKNSAFGEHGLENNSGENITILVYQESDL